MVDIQRVRYVSQKAVHTRIVRSLRQRGSTFHHSRGHYYIDRGDRVACYSLEQLASLLEVLRPWERVECYWRRTVAQSIEEQTPSLGVMGHHVHAGDAKQ
jgi:hypothetical protein